jgi:hypothetical protein
MLTSICPPSRLELSLLGPDNSLRSLNKKEPTVTEKDFQKELTLWLEEYPWQWLCSLTFRPYFRLGQRKARMRKWMEELKEELGTSDFSIVAVPELGTTGDDYHFHALVGGLSAWYAAERLDWMKRWRRLSGDARIDPYQPNKGGIAYVLKNVGPDDFDEIEFDLSPHTRLQSRLIK